MGYDKIAGSIDEFERLCSELAIEIPERSPFRCNIALVKEFVGDIKISSNEAVQKWNRHPSTSGIGQFSASRNSAPQCRNFAITGTTSRNSSRLP